MSVTTLDSTKTDRLPRRPIQWLMISAWWLALALAGIPDLVQASTPKCSPRNSCLEPKKERKKGRALFKPFEIRSRNGVLSTELSIRYFSDVSVGDKNDLNLRMYGYPNPGGASPHACRGEYCYTLPGPIFRVKKGDTFNLTLKNELSDAPPSPHDECNPENKHHDEFPNCYHGNNVTNFHFHGFHISPLPPHDNIFLKLKIGEQYNITSGVIPPTQAEGTHWYHPHHHGATALQVINGMAGAFIVEGDFDEKLKEFYPNGLEEKILIIQQINDVIPFPDLNLNARVQFVVNGQLSPDLAIGMGEIERWRVINATATKSSIVDLIFPEGGVEVRQIAMDGIQFAPENYRDQPLLREDGRGIEMAPGNRADFLVKGVGKKGKAMTESVSIDDFAVGVRAKIRQATARPLFALKRDRRYKDGDMEFPPVDQWPALPSYLRNVEASEIRAKRRVKFSMTGTAGGEDPSIEFFIDDRQFDANCVDQRMALGTAEEWTFDNLPGVNRPIPHPAHIHVNPFQVWTREGQEHPNGYPIWQDTIALPEDELKETVIRHRFENFEGMFVMHCHILGHEDRGMMQTIEVGDQSGCPLCPTSEADSRCTEYRRKLGAGEVP